MRRGNYREPVGNGLANESVHIHGRLLSMFRDAVGFKSGCDRYLVYDSKLASLSPLRRNESETLSLPLPPSIVPDRKAMSVAINCRFSSDSTVSVLFLFFFFMIKILPLLQSKYLGLLLSFPQRCLGSRNLKRFLIGTQVDIKNWIIPN